MEEAGLKRRKEVREKLHVTSQPQTESAWYSGRYITSKICFTPRLRMGCQTLTQVSSWRWVFQECSASRALLVLCTKN